MVEARAGDREIGRAVVHKMSATTSLSRAHDPWFEFGEAYGGDEESNGDGLLRFCHDCERKLSDRKLLARRNGMLGGKS